MHRWSCTWFSRPSHKFGIFLELDVVIALVLHQHHLQIDVITNLEPPHPSVSLLVQGHCCSHVAGEWTRARSRTRAGTLERSKSNTNKVNYCMPAVLCSEPGEPNMIQFLCVLLMNCVQLIMSDIFHTNTHTHTHTHTFSLLYLTCHQQLSCSKMPSNLRFYLSAVLRSSR